MKDKVKNLYKNDFEKFIKLLKLFYGSDEVGLFAVLQDFYKKDTFYFIIDGRLVSFETVLEDFTDIVKQYKLLKGFKLV
jgi:predicted acetyltransferase